MHVLVVTKAAVGKTVRIRTLQRPMATLRGDTECQGYLSSPKSPQRFPQSFMLNHLLQLMPNDGISSFSFEL